MEEEVRDLRNDGSGARDGTAERDCADTLASGGSIHVPLVPGVVPHCSESNGDEDEEQLIDEFGFILDKEEKERDLLYVRNTDGKMVVRRQIKWNDMTSNWEEICTKRRAKLKERCRKGIPASFRGIAWQLLIGSRQQMMDPRNAGVYESLRNKKLSDTQVTEVISRDLARTFPKHILFRKEGGIGQTFLRNVLHAYACADPEVGYVQGMGFVVGALSTQMAEEEAFWALHALMYSNTIQLREMYRPGFPMLHRLFYQLKRLMEKLLPNLHHHFQKLGVEPAFFASQWFMTLFVYHFNFRGLLRIWDVFMSEGWKIIFRVAIALMGWEERRLLSMQFDEIIPALKNLHQDKDPDEIVQRAHRVKFKTKELQGFGLEFDGTQAAGGV
ncbi:Rab GTPase TBC domain [Trypanosoma vivax]|uniref:Putative rab-like GTPase activating protein n=1 Tax=Trypanosoma vivax (strain Y486) TaxID=1055687 RepID=G0U7F4_TRYVY|nr:putative rab-like GTPase activating protein [Trypanosoma vivax]KAH8620669.1 Rab GTPase TBC domain [Trypanosoma vivax]CCC51812.1 putative rab-like GTPase activating protein [Trypanosoma vivax Y486]